MYPILLVVLFISALLALVLTIGILGRPAFWRAHKKIICSISLVWFVTYFTFIAAFTGPVDISTYPSAETSPYKLPWEGGVRRFVAQGNRSFLSHRDSHLNAWDFVMPVGTKVLAAREGKVSHVEVEHDGVGYLANYIVIEHADGARTGYAHLQKGGTFVSAGERVEQGQPIGLSGLVGQTLFPHLHFYAIEYDGKPKSISFKEVPGGIPLAGRFYTSENQR